MNTPECSTHYVTSIRTHNSQRTEHKNIKCSNILYSHGLLSIVSIVLDNYISFSCLYTVEMNWLLFVVVVKVSDLKFLEV